MNLSLTTLPARSLLLVLIMAKLLAPSAAEQPEKRASQDPYSDHAVLVQHLKLTESSGLAASNRQPGLFWSHNDSGGEPQLFAFDQAGKKTGLCRLNGADAIDWEDMASFILKGKARLIVADCGDNDANRDSIVLYLLDEPNPRKSTELSTFRKLIVTYPDGACDCEAIAVDSRRDQIILVAKTHFTAAGIYTIPLAAALQNQRLTTRVTATRTATLLLPMVSAMDVHPASGDIWIINYFKAFRFPCTARGQPLDQQLSQLPKPVDLPRWKQIEAVAVDSDDHVWVTSEGKPAPLGRLRPQED